MRAIPSLQVLCLRSVGSHACSAKATFASTTSIPDENEESTKPAKSKKRKHKQEDDGSSSNLTNASRLLRSYHRRPVVSSNQTLNSEDGDDAHGDAWRNIPMERSPCIGSGSSRRAQANEVDLNHPWIGCAFSASPGHEKTFVMQFGSPALDCLQSYVDSLVELGRMDDTRLEKHFFREYKANILLAAGVQDPEAVEKAVASSPPPPPPKRRRGRSPTTTPAQQQQLALLQASAAAMGSLSLHNCTLSSGTINAMVESGVFRHLAILDLTGVHGLTDDNLSDVIPLIRPHIQRLSLKNCRRITVKGLGLLTSSRRQQAASNLSALDIGGCYNISTSDVLDVVPGLISLVELHASGLDWTDASVESLVVEIRRPWKALSFGFSGDKLTHGGIRNSLCNVSDSLVSLAMPFCEAVFDNALLGMMGRNLPKVQYLDVRGNSSLTTLTGWYDGRASANLPMGNQPLYLLARYSGLSAAAVEETRRIHPVATADNQLTVVLDGGGTGVGIMRAL